MLSQFIHHVVFFHLFCNLFSFGLWLVFSRVCCTHVCFHWHEVYSFSFSCLSEPMLFMFGTDIMTSRLFLLGIETQTKCLVLKHFCGVTVLQGVLTFGETEVSLIIYEGARGGALFSHPVLGRTWGLISCPGGLITRPG